MTIDAKFAEMGILGLIEEDKKSFAKRLSYLLQDYPELTNYLNRGILEPDVEKLKKYVISTLAIVDNFRGITDARIGFGYGISPGYRVTYKVIQYCSQTNKYDYTNVSDDTHTIAVEREAEMFIDPKNLI